MMPISIHSDKWAPWLILAIGLTVTLLFWQSEKERAIRDLQTTFDFRVQQIADELQQQVVNHGQLLSGVQSLFAASEHVEREEFRRYASTLRLLENHPGIKALGFAPLIKDGDKNAHVIAMRKENPAYSVWPAGIREHYAPVIYIEPIRDNFRALGYDIHSDSVRRAAMSLASGTGEATMSGKLSLVQNADNDQPTSFAVYLPIYRNGSIHETPLQRQAALAGWIYAAFQVEILMNTMFGDKPADVDIEIYDGDTINDGMLMFDHDRIRRAQQTSASQYQTTQRLNLLDHRWTLVVSSLPIFEAQLDHKKSYIIAFAGISLSLLLALLFWLLINRTRSLQDIYQINQALISSEQHWKFALEGAGDGVWDWDIITNEIQFSRRWKEMLGYSEQEVGTGMDDWISRVHPEDVTRITASLKSYCDGETQAYLNEHRMRCKNGDWRWMLTRGMIVSRTAEGKPLRMMGTHTDITKLKESEELLWKQANFDTLTDLPNRRMFYDRLEQEIKKAHRTKTPLALIFLDLDHFKEINDTLGHDQGDLLLKKVAARLLGCVRETDTVARLGGDEFILILNDTDKVERAAQDILQKLSAPYYLQNEMVYVSASIGITLYPEDALKIEDMLKNVDQAMYAAKNHGRNRYSYFTQSMQMASQARMQLSNDLRTALAQQQFKIVYQPIVDLSSGAIFKAEALIRWQHPTRGLISPAEFIPIAEDTGLIIDIGDWVFRQAAQQVKVWRESRHIDFQISINKSPVQFRNNDKVHAPWYKYLCELGLPGQCIAVEITESLLLDATDSVTDIFHEFKEAGIQVSLDDFGTGYSSLSYLKKFDIDYIKIDQSFIANLSAESEDMALCEAIIVMSHKLGLKVIAEGIETTQQRDLLAAAGCDFGQGYLFAKPLSAEEFERLL